VPGDRSAASPGGVRIGAPALTTRGFKEADFEAIGALLDRAAQAALKIQEVSGKKLVDFVARLEGNEEVAAIGKDSSALATRFPMPGFDVTQMKYNTL
jgi:glycine hydroxymethyltransferase